MRGVFFVFTKFYTQVRVPFFHVCRWFAFSGVVSLKWKNYLEEEKRIKKVITAFLSILSFKPSYVLHQKGAVDSLTIGLAKELADENIHVNAVRPAFIHTGIHASGGEPNRIERIKETIPLKRGGLASEVAEAILWLATKQSSYSTGIFIDVTGGR